MPPTRPEDGASGVPSDAQQLSRVRELLFGEATRALEERIVALEVRIQEEGERARREFAGRIDAVRDELRRGLERLQADVMRERDERMSAVRELQGELRTGLEAVAQGAAEARASLSDELSREGLERVEALGEKLDATASVLGQRIEAGDASLQRAVDEGLARVERSAVDRSGLARDLSALAARLGSEPDATVVEPPDAPEVEKR